MCEFEKCVGMFENLLANLLAALVQPMELNYGLTIDPAANELCCEVGRQATNVYVSIDESVYVS